MTVIQNTDRLAIHTITTKPWQIEEAIDGMLLPE
jgi:hypothetical protein